MGYGSVSALCCYVSVHFGSCFQTNSKPSHYETIMLFCFLLTLSTFLMAFSEYSLKFLVTPSFFKWMSTVLICNKSLSKALFVLNYSGN